MSNRKDAGPRVGLPRWRRRARLTALGLAAAVAVVVMVPRQNFGVVDPGRAYRSAQPRGELAGVIRERGLRSVVNLRGGSPAEPWYAAEVATTRAAGVDFYDYPMSATTRPSRRDLLTLVDLFAGCRYPVLIHCKSGSDRTGLATAVYRMVARGEAPTEALSAFSVRYGHVPLLGPERLHEPLEEYAAWLAERRLTHTPERFRAWVAVYYRSDDAADGYRPVQPGPRPQVPPGLAGAGAGAAQRRR